MTKPNPGQPVALAATIERFTFRNPDTGWAVVRMVEQGTGRLVTAVGPMAELREGQNLRIEGTESEHPRFGCQVQVESFEAIAPTTVEGIEALIERLTDKFNELMLLSEKQNG